MRPILMKGHERPLTFLKYNRDGDLLFSCAKDHTPTVWFADNGERLGTYRGHNGAVWCCDVSRDSSMLITGSADQSVKLWDVQTGAHGGGEQSRGRGGRSRGRGAVGGGGSSNDKIYALGRLMTRILCHMASELNLNMRSDGFVKLQDLLKLNMKTFANVPLISHTVDDVKEAVRRDNKQRFSLLEENGELLIRANQGHTLKTVETESLLIPILSVEEVPVCVHGTYKKNLELILESGLKRMQRLHVHFSCGLPTDGEVISGMRGNVNVLIFLDVRKALEDRMKLYLSDNRVILTEGFDGVVPVKYFERPYRHPITF